MAPEILGSLQDLLVPAVRELRGLLEDHWGPGDRWGLLDHQTQWSPSDPQPRAFPAGQVDLCYQADLGSRLTPSSPASQQLLGVPGVLPRPAESNFETLQWLGAQVGFEICSELVKFWNILVVCHSKPTKFFAFLSGLV